MTARELIREGHRTTIFEQGSRLGGVWVYTDKVEESHGQPGGHQLTCPEIIQCSDHRLRSSLALIWHRDALLLAISHALFVFRGAKKA